MCGCVHVICVRDVGGGGGKVWALSICSHSPRATQEPARPAPSSAPWSQPGSFLNLSEAVAPQCPLLANSSRALKLFT